MNRWDAFTTVELVLLKNGSPDDALGTEMAGEFERRIESKAGACPPQGESPEAWDASPGRGWKRCPHPFGWRYNTHRRRRWCRVCAYQQCYDQETGEWVDARMLDA